MITYAERTGRQGEIFDMYYKADVAIQQYAAVVCGAEDGGIALPGGANAPRIVGITMTGGAAGKNIRVRKGGIAHVYSNGAISFGDRLVIASATGDVKSVESIIEAGTNDIEFVIGTAEQSCIASGTLIMVWVAPQVVPKGTGV